MLSFNFRIGLQSNTHQANVCMVKHFLTIILFVPPCIKFSLLYKNKNIYFNHKLKAIFFYAVKMRNLLLLMKQNLKKLFTQVHSKTKYF